MRIVIISDTHGEHEHLTVPNGDVLISCGDWSPGHGSRMDTEQFAAWMGTLPHRYKIAVPGNHEAWVEDDPLHANRIFKAHSIRLMLGHSDEPTRTFEGVTFGGAPWSLDMRIEEHRWHPRAFEDDEKFLDEVKWNRIPHVDVLVSHVPPMGILDTTSKGEHLGCPIARKHVLERIRPRLHVFGHVHHAAGQVVEDGIRFINAASRTRTTSKLSGDCVEIFSHGLRMPVVVDLES